MEKQNKFQELKKKPVVSLDEYSQALVQEIEEIQKKITQKADSFIVS